MLGGACAIVAADSGHAQHAARRLGAHYIPVSSGYTAVPARFLGAKRVIDRFAELPEALARLAEMGA